MPRIVVDIDQAGNISVTSDIKSKALLLGIMEIAKNALLNPPVIKEEPMIKPVKVVGRIDGN